MDKGILFKGNVKEGIYKLIKTTNGWVLEGENIAYAGFDVDDTPKVNAELRADFLKRQYEAALKEIERLKADRPQGEWIDKGDYAECSNCGADGGTQFNGIEPVPRKTKFCPNCGARMKGEGDDI